MGCSSSPCCTIGVIVEVEWVLFTGRMAVGKLGETSQNIVAGMTRVHITIGLAKVETSATFQGPLLWSTNTAEIYDQESE
jgi:hypothetical protein